MKREWQEARKQGGLEKAILKRSVRCSLLRDVIEGSQITPEQPLAEGIPAEEEAERPAWWDA